MRKALEIYTPFKSKWGRHCCRPHSHQRVGALLLHFAQANLCSVLLRMRTWRPVSVPRPAASLSLRSPLLPCFAVRRTGARTGIRPCFVTISLCSNRSSPFARWPLSKAETMILSVLGRGCRPGPKSPFLQLSPASIMAFNDDVASLYSQTIQLASGRSLFHVVSRTARGQSPPCLLYSIYSEIQCLAAFLSEPSCSEDKLKMRPNRHQDKVCASDFSTFAKISCGERWKTQRAIELTLFERDLERDYTIAWVQNRNRDFPEILPDRFGFDYAVLVNRVLSLGPGCVGRAVSAAMR